jgi:hypothetical protein
MSSTDDTREPNIYFRPTSTPNAAMPKAVRFATIALEFGCKLCCQLEKEDL